MKPKVLLLSLAAAVPVLAPLGLPLVEPRQAAALINALLAQTGAPNVVSGVILHTRLYDTIAEVVVFTLAALGVSWMLQEEPDAGPVRALGDPAVGVLCRLGATVAALVAVELALRGHLSPGGGFASGVAGGTAIGLLLITGSASTLERLQRRSRADRWEKGSVLAFLALAAVGLEGLDLPGGRFGSIASGGWIPLLNTVMALKVMLGSWSMLQAFVRARGLL
ncbi:Na(+)/H(+) antiporter subunit B [Cyanobium sp. Morenito 9A2]|uniref:Na(+)/H(+) antiporter subunit B n=1 Tax=Cyanobium sp. Morenito 9A2 TaxID=2823718 RepID=UPI0020CDA7D9|nr:Na(+)/H(+) antiporter subunit B [Cyanobium sp. Morenito 9A2]MCP9848891.1 Na(+)/H(+) antiporter subunit B [Cyanobium sp. Morenito 9A2]